MAPVVTPVRPPPSAQPSQPGASAAGNPGALLPGNLVTTGATALRTPPTATAAALDSSISNDLYAINARATSFARCIGSLEFADAAGVGHAAAGADRYTDSYGGPADSTAGLDRAAHPEPSP